MDANKNVLAGRMCRQLTATDKGLQEITQDFLGSLCPFTYAVKWPTFEESSGDHRACVFKFTSPSAIGSHKKSIVYPLCWRLTSTRPDSMINYSEELIPQFSIHRNEDRMDTIAAISRVMSMAALTEVPLIWVWIILVMRIDENLMTGTK